MKKRIGIIGVLVAILALGIGYAVINATDLEVTGSGTISPDDSNFDVHFKQTETITKTGPAGATLTASYTNGTTATSGITGFTKKDDTATFVYTIENSSPDLLANLAVVTADIENTNDEYFDVTAALGKAKLNASGDTTTLTITVTALKTPIEDDETTTITVPVTASPTHS